MTDYYVLHSGGLDSTVALTEAINKNDGTVYSVGITYGQKHARELDAARTIANHLGAEPIHLDLTGYGTSVTSALTTTAPIPLGEYDESNMQSTVVPGRNAVFLAAVTGIAASRPTNAEVVTAVHGGDHYIYPDCRPDFIQAMSAATTLATGVPVTAPYVEATKADIVARGDEVGAPLHLTWSCYEGGDIHCGKCGTCIERKQAFQQAGVPDPTEYAA